MDSRVVYMYIFMLLALLIGFLIGWILRRSAYKKHYKEENYKLQYIEEEKFKILNREKLDLESLQNLYLDNKDSFRIKSERLDKYIDQDSKLNIEIDKSKKEHETLVKDIPIVDDKINDALVNLEKVKSVREPFLEQIKKVDDYEENISEIKSDIDSIELLVPPSLERKNELTKNFEKLTERFEAEHKQLHDIDIKIVEAKEEYAIKKASVESELKESMLQEDVYAKVLVKIEDKIINGKDLLDSDFAGLLNEKKANNLGLINHIKNIFKGEK